VLQGNKGGLTIIVQNSIIVPLPYQPPLDGIGVLRFLEWRAIPGVEMVADGAYHRTIDVDGAPGTMTIRPGPDQYQLCVRAVLCDGEALLRITERARRIFDLDTDPRRILARLRRSRPLARFARRCRGIRVPGTWDPFELAVRAVLGQQVTVKGASTLAGRLARTFGREVEGFGGGLSNLFPTAEVLAEADVALIGVPRSRAATIRSLASSVARGELTLDPSTLSADSISRLTALPGIGDWTAAYIAMRALRDPDAFPGDDLGLRRALARNGQPLPRSELEDMAEEWRPWRAYAAMILWTGNQREAL
jgi:AraC family transcriptional regulator of adaptative response / DNA-3-methyladenine glycosylase II